MYIIAFCFDRGLSFYFQTHTNLYNKNELPLLGMACLKNQQTCLNVCPKTFFDFLCHSVGLCKQSFYIYCKLFLYKGKQCKIINNTDLLVFENKCSCLLKCLLKVLETNLVKVNLNFLDSHTRTHTVTHLHT